MEDFVLKRQLPLACLAKGCIIVEDEVPGFGKHQGAGLGHMFGFSSFHCVVRSVS